MSNSRPAPKRTQRKNRISRTVHRHDWNSLEEWVRTLDELSDLSDHEIDDLVRMAANDADSED